MGHYAAWFKEKQPDKFLRLSQQHPKPRLWTEVEHAQFVDGVRVAGWGNWVLVAKYIPTKTHRQVKNYAGKIKQRGLKDSIVNGESPAAFDVAHGINNEAVRNVVHDNSEVAAGLPPLPIVDNVAAFDVAQGITIVEV
jgi:hypothetical protein